MDNSSLDVSELIPLIVSPQEVTDLEAANVREATIEYLFRDPLVDGDGREFDFCWMLALHRGMFGRVWRWAGRLRKSELTIGIPPIEVEQRLYDLAESIPFFKSPPSHDDFAYLHHQLTVIHPFKNGNGRWSRMVANLYQYRHTYCYAKWPEEVTGKHSLTSQLRVEYLAALRAADRGDLGPLAELHVRYTVEQDL